MNQNDAHIRAPFPEEMHVLLADYPRAGWPDHPHFAQSIQNWLNAHQMFKKLTSINAAKTRSWLNRDADDEKFASELAFYGNQLIANLHGHHHWEDSQYFPEIRRFESRFDNGLEVLESDHVALDGILDKLTGSGNRLIKLLHLDREQAKTEADQFLGHTEAVGRLLDQHLADEEDLIVPILLHHRMRG